MEAAASYAKAEKAPTTRRAYGTDFAIFRTWCAERGADPLPATPETVAAFLASEAGRRVRPSTIGRRVAAIRYAHNLDFRPDTPWVSWDWLRRRPPSLRTGRPRCFRSWRNRQFWSLLG